MVLKLKLKSGVGVQNSNKNTVHFVYYAAFIIKKHMQTSLIFEESLRE